MCAIKIIYYYYYWYCYNYNFITVYYQNADSVQ